MRNSSGTVRCDFFLDSTLAFFGGAFCSALAKASLSSFRFSYWQLFFVCLYVYVRSFVFFVREQGVLAVADAAVAMDANQDA